MIRDKYLVLIAFGAILLLLGDGLLYVGLVGDRLGWTTQSAFGSNILAGVTTACFGVPVALFLLNILYSWQSDLRQERQSKQLKLRALHDLLVVDGRTWGDREREAVRKSVPLVRRTLVGHRDLFTKLESDRSRVGSTPSDVPEYQRWLVQSIDDLTEVKRLLREALVSRQSALAEWTSRRARWRFLDGTVRERVFESQTEWLTAGHYGALYGCFAGGEYPFEQALQYLEEWVPSALEILEDYRIARWSSPPPSTDHALSMALGYMSPPFGVADASGIERFHGSISETIDALDSVRQANL